MITTTQLKRRTFLQGSAAFGSMAVLGAMPNVASAETYDTTLNIMSHPGFPRFNGDLTSSGYLRPLDDLIEKHDAAALFDNISDAYRSLYCEWGGKTIAVPVDGDVAMMYFRKDAFENEEAKTRYREKFGKELTVPRTWEEFLQAAEIFTGWDWAGSGKAGYGFQTSTW